MCQSLMVQFLIGVAVVAAAAVALVFLAALVSLLGVLVGMTKYGSGGENLLEDCKLGLAALAMVTIIVGLVYGLVCLLVQLSTQPWFRFAAAATIGNYILWWVVSGPLDSLLGIWDMRSPFSWWAPWRDEYECGSPFIWVLYGLAFACFLAAAGGVIWASFRFLMFLGGAICPVIFGG